MMLHVPPNFSAIVLLKCVLIFFIKLENMTFKRYKLIKMIRHIFFLNIFQVRSHVIN